MAVRKQHNRYRTEPYGEDFKDVLKRGKAFHKDGMFMMWEYFGLWTASRLPASGRLPMGARVYKKINGRWHEQDAEWINDNL